MTKTKLHALAGLGQSVWMDYIRRSSIDSGELQHYVNKGLRGVTSNPAIFEKAITGGNEYDEDLKRLARQGRTPIEIYEALAIADIQRAADVLRPVYEGTSAGHPIAAKGDDGYVSLEVNPTLAHDTQRTIDEARHLFEAVDRPNVMIKVPATSEGLPAIETLTAEGINVNVTLIFSLAQYDHVVDAYLRGLEARTALGRPLDGIASVASFFVSRIDVKVDKALGQLNRPEATALQGKIGIAVAKMVYQRFKATCREERWERLSDAARVQRVLYGSTSTKNPDYPDILYVDNLIGFLVRKLGAPGHPELAMGAIASGGIRVLNSDIVDALRVPNEAIDMVSETERTELERRERAYRSSTDVLELSGHTVILVDDGLATGATMRAAIEGVWAHEPRRVIVAVPVAAPEVCKELSSVVDEMVCLETPVDFMGVGAWYRDFGQTSDADVKSALAEASWIASD